MNVLNNKYITFSLHRDIDLEAFYEIDKKYRWSIIFAHMMIHFLPVLIITLYFRGFFGDEYFYEVLTISLLFYAAVILETTAYLFPSSRKMLKRYLLWFLIPFVIGVGYAGYIVGVGIMTMESDISRAGMLFGGIAGGFGIFVWTYLGMSLILKASRAIYTNKAAIEADVRFATEVQERILEDVSIEYNSSMGYAKSVPANELGGDFFELSLHEDTFFACIGDVSGHSFGAGLLMTLTKSALQTHLEYNHNPSEIFESLNSLFLRQSDRSMYATMGLIKINLSTCKAELCNAGHLPVLHYMPEKGILEHRYRKGLGLGMIDKARFETLEFPVQKGDLLFIYSDGLIETRDEQSNIRESDFFEEIISRLVRQHIDSPEELSILIFAEIQKNDYSKKFEDDATLIIIKV